MKIIKKIWHLIYFVFDILLYFLSFPLAFILYGKKKYWLISEIDFDARDNGYHFFKYINENHPEINSIYLISKKNPYYSKVHEIGKTVEPHSYKHMLLFIASKAKISTVVFGCSPSWCVTNLMKKFHGTGKNIALKHGISKNIHPNYFNENAHLDLICCGAKPEYDFIKNNFHYEGSATKYTGLARFDALRNNSVTNEIFIMPTWRRWLDKISIDEFKKSEFYKSWNLLLNNKLLLNFAKENNYDIVFFVHPKMNKSLSLSLRCENKNIKILYSKDGCDIQQHLKRAKLLITDFSSVFFDFAYMKKPSIYYQFDEDEYYKLHYKKAYFDYRRDGFGLVANTIEEVESELNYLFSNNFKIDKTYIERINNFFALNDTKNCERIYYAIKDVINGK